MAWTRIKASGMVNVRFRVWLKFWVRLWLV
jgi:hypothetical protein